MRAARLPPPAVKADGPPRRSPHRTGPALGAALVLAAAAGFGANAIAAKLAYASGATFASLLAVRFVASAAVLGPVAAYTRRRGTARVRPAAAAAVGLTYLGAVASFWWALKLGAVSDVAPLAYLYPVIVAGVGFALGERSGAAVPIAMGMSVAGLVLLFGTPSADANDLLAKGLALTSGVMTAGYFLAGARIMGRGQGIQTVAVTCAMGVCAFAPAMLLSGSRGGDLADAWPYVLLIVVAGTTLPLLFMQWGVTRVGSTRASMLSLLEPVVTLALAVLILHESPSVGAMLGGVLILAAVPVALSGRRRAPA
jgi:drug/metabolite transporter (DMT)-like permease